MGVPKFFRYISERYPCLSEVVKDYQVPEFDNLYLDMNGIIHNCTHPDDNIHFRISEEKMFQDIFHYIECLFRMIKPQKLFFMAIDGVAPRAKMNQQRGRRFRSAKDAEKAEAKAREKGEKLPEEARFDSNCITPGTVFMANLHEQLKYFVTNKITTDPLWQNCKIILSGHETPGEGEHKIMDYIRFLRAQPGYDPNTRHCLYGLDADLIMLGLCTHEKHFSLLREEVKFGKKSTSKRQCVPEQITFFLLHLSLMREYLEMEFLPLKGSLSFEYDFEKIIDDWVLMGFLVGNDFIPHLPNLHIANGALPLIYRAYMRVLPTLGGYINESGYLNLERFEKFLEALSEIDLDVFSENYADLKYFEAKTGRRPNEQTRTSYKPKQLEAWAPDMEPDSFMGVDESIETKKPMSSDLKALIQATEDMFLEPSPENLKDIEKDEDYEDVSDSLSVEEDMDDGDMFQAEFKLHKRDYYMNKLKYEQVTSDVMKSQAEGYIRAIQWNLHYYYHGVCSWSWFYPHHYAPYITDIKGFSNMKLEFQLGEPFQPYEQLLAVLPSASKNLLPECYHELMTKKESLIESYYPEEFETDLNGKKQDWEAVVLIPFIDEQLLLEAMKPCNALLTPDEVKRNTHGPMLVYSYTENDLGEYPAPQYFPTIKANHADLLRLSIDDIKVPREKLIKGAYPGAKMDTFYPGFPTFKHLNYKSSIEKAKVKVFEQPSRNESVIVTLKNEEFAALSTREVAEKLVGKQIFVAWPHLVEALVVGVSDREYKFKLGNDGSAVLEYNNDKMAQKFKVENSIMVDHYKTRLGIEMGNDVNVLVHVKQMTGRRYCYLPSTGRVNLEKQWSDQISNFPLQTIVKDIKVFEKGYVMYHDLASIFPDGTKCFFLGHPGYGSFCEVVDSEESCKKGRVCIIMNKIEEEPPLNEIIEMEKDIATKYMPAYIAASKLSMSKILLSRITGSILVHKASNPNEDAARTDIGLNLKHNKRNKEIPGYTKRVNNNWLYSEKLLKLVEEYMHFCPELFLYLSTHFGNDVFYEDEVFSDCDAREKIREIVEWKKKQHFYSVEPQTCDTQILEESIVKKIEEVVDEYSKNCIIKNVPLNVKPDTLYKSTLYLGNVHPDTQAKFYLYDRVVNVRESYTVPLGLSGTVIGIHKALPDKDSEFLYDVVFDEPFAGGLQLNCSPNRGYTLPATALINRSHGIREYEKKTGKPGHLIQSLQNQQQKPQYSNVAQNQNNQPYYQQHQSSAFASWNNQRTNIQNHAQYSNQSSPGHSRNMNYQQKGYQNKTDFMPIFQNKSQDNSPVHQPRNQGYKNQNNQQYNVSPQKSMTDDYKQYKILKNDRASSQSQNDRRGYQNNPAVDNQKKKSNYQDTNNSNMTNLPPEVVNTDFLKKVLKIGENPELSPSRVDNSKTSLETQNTNEKTEVKQEDTKINLQDIFAHAKAQRQQQHHQQPPTSHQPKAHNMPPPKKATNSCFYSMQLLSFYQAKGLGCPNYQYFPLPNGKFQAQVRIPNGKTMFGNLADSKEQACENVAEAVMKTLLGTPNKDSAPRNAAPPVPVQSIPAPPPQWRQNPGFPPNPAFIPTSVYTLNPMVPVPGLAFPPGPNVLHRLPKTQVVPPHVKQIQNNRITHRSTNQMQNQKSPLGMQALDQGVTQRNTSSDATSSADSEPGQKTSPTKSSAAMFVPLQAVKHINKSATSSQKDDSTTKENSPQKNKSNNHSTSRETKQGSAQSKGDHPSGNKNRKVRKSRLAANFENVQ